MKHVFITHSNITKILIEGIIRDLELKKQQVLIISFRNSSIEGFNNIDLEEYRIKTVHLFKTKDYKNRILKRTEVLRIIDQVDKIVDLKEDYILYTPQVFNPFFQIVASNKRCKKINFIEEGMVSYFYEDRVGKLPFLNRIARFFLYNNRLPSGKFFESASFKKVNEPEFFVFSEGAFKSAAHRKLVKVKNDEKKITDGAIVFVLDAIVEFKKGTEMEVMNAVEQFIQDNRNEKLIYLKFHPQQHLDIKENVQNVLQRTFTVNVLNNDVVLEKEFLCERNEKLKIFGIISSLLFYAHHSGHYTKSYSIFLKTRQKSVQQIKDLYISLGI